MKKLKLVVVVAGFAISTVVNAQDKTDISKPLNTIESVDVDDDSHVEKLNLTSEQKTQIKEIRAKRIAEKMELKMKLKDIRVAERLEINSILTDEQRVVAKEKKEIKHENFKGKKQSHKDKKKDE